MDLLQSAFAVVCSGLQKVSWVLVGNPIFYVYLHGPSWMGGWKSRPEEDICAQLTSVEADFWYKNPSQCTDLIFRDFHAIYAVVQLVLYLWLLFQLMQTCMFRYLIFRPLYDSPPPMMISYGMAPALCNTLQKKRN